MQNYFSKVFGIKFNGTLGDECAFVFWFVVHVLAIASLIVLSIVFLTCK